MSLAARLAVPCFLGTSLCLREAAGPEGGLEMPPEDPASLLLGSPWQLKLSFTLSLQAIDLESFPEPGCPELGALGAAGS